MEKVSDNGSVIDEVVDGTESGDEETEETVAELDDSKATLTKTELHCMKCVIHLVWHNRTLS